MPMRSSVLSRRCPFAALASAALLGCALGPPAIELRSLPEFEALSLPSSEAALIARSALSSLYLFSSSSSFAKQYRDRHFDFFNASCARACWRGRKGTRHILHNPEVPVHGRLNLNTLPAPPPTIDSIL